MTAMKAPTQDTEAAKAAALNPDARVSFKDSRHIRQLCLAFDPVTDEMKVEVEGDGLHALGVDAAHVLMARLHVKPEALEAYRMSQPGEALIETDRLLQAAKSFNLGDPASLFFNGSKGRLEAEQGRVSRRAPYMDGLEAVKEPKVPSLHLPGKATVPEIGELFDFVKHAKKETADALEVIVSNVDGLTVRAEGDRGTDEYRATVDEIQPDRAFEQGPEKSVRSVFSGDYLASILKVAKKMDTGTDAGVRLHVGDDYPLRAVVENAPLCVEYILAPRIE